jgi:hypothetical protein
MVHPGGKGHKIHRLDNQQTIRTKAFLIEVALEYSQHILHNKGKSKFNKISNDGVVPKT